MNVTDDVRWDGSLTEQVSHSSSYTYTYTILCHDVICDSVYIASCCHLLLWQYTLKMLVELSYILREESL